MLNNFAFGYNISVPVHIILRSGGSVMTMLVGYVWGKRYTSMQIFSVTMLTAGIGVAAMADAQAKGKMKSTSSTKIDPEFITGLMILAVAQLLSAIMGIYSELTYSEYGRHWHENLFYQHSLSIPMFYPFFPSLLEQLKKLVYSEPIQLSPSLYQFLHTKSNSTFGSGDLQLPPMALSPSVFQVALPKHVFNLIVNAGTQFACIRGVNALSARTSALGVSIALNVRKLVSLCVSLWLFGNKLPPGVLLGAVIVFGSTSIWAWEGQRIRIKDKRKGKMQ
ncbi:MAG: golgi uridine diphosphate-N- acetylglucosamine transporter [Alectoria fallacina]|uniref:Golgi uridine diphosphate-N- acetylglucosamine transporter n=1 Tax=Alectoria fallacina TaxID=1903189 RepID=A0A8H3EEP6_9LECA|nr:MAG: golgi uridine diphosphate-N- acetylglucosamine transporter [Alectoria fallacina]